MPARLDISMQRNEDFGCSIEIADNTGAPIDLTGWTLRLAVKERLEATAVLQLAEIEVIDATLGWIDIRIQGPGAPLGGYGDPLLSYDLPFDFQATDGLGMPTVLFAGYLTLSRGIS